MMTSCVYYVLSHPPFTHHAHFTAHNLPTSIHLCTQAINATMARAKCYHTMDAFVKLVVVLVRFSGDATNTITKVNLLNKVSHSLIPIPHSSSHVTWERD